MEYNGLQLKTSDYGHTLIMHTEDSDGKLQGHYITMSRVVDKDNSLVFKMLSFQEYEKGVQVGRHISTAFNGSIFLYLIQKDGSKRMARKIPHDVTVEDLISMPEDTILTYMS